MDRTLQRRDHPGGGTGLDPGRIDDHRTAAGRDQHIPPIAGHRYTARGPGNRNLTGHGQAPSLERAGHQHLVRRGEHPPTIRRGRHPERLPGASTMLLRTPAAFGAAAVAAAQRLPCADLQPWPGRCQRRTPQHRQYRRDPGHDGEQPQPAHPTIVAGRADGWSPVRTPRRRRRAPRSPRRARPPNRAAAPRRSCTTTWRSPASLRHPAAAPSRPRSTNGTTETVARNLLATASPIAPPRCRSGGCCGCRGGDGLVAVMRSSS